MRRLVWAGSLIIEFLIASDCFAETHVFWYKCIQNNYALTDNPGPNIQGNVIKHEGMIASASLNQRNNALQSMFAIGSGLDDAQGRCGMLWFRDLMHLKGTVTRAVARAEYTQLYLSSSGCSDVCQGPIRIRCGVVDFSGNLATYGGENRVPDTAKWADSLYSFGPTTGFNVLNNSSLMQEEIFDITAPAGRSSDQEPDRIAKQFVELDLADQIHWILSHTGKDNPNKVGDSASYAIVLLVEVAQGSTGKISTYSAESCIRPIGEGNPWTQDGNTMHLLIEGILSETVAEKGYNRELMIGMDIVVTPNPFYEGTTITYWLGTGQHGQIEVLDISGKRIMVQNVEQSGSVRLGHDKLPAGLYVCRLLQGKSQKTTRIVRLQ